MKKLLFALMIFTGSIAQERFEFTPEGFTDFVVTNVDGSQAEIYAKTINWIKETFKNPDKVILMTMENEKLRFEGLTENALCQKYFGDVCSNAKYVIEVSFKDGKYKFDPISLNFYNRMNLKGYDVPLNNIGGTYYKNGKILKGNEEVPEAFERLFNGLNESLKSYISGGGKSNDDW